MSLGLRDAERNLVEPRGASQIDEKEKTGPRVNSKPLWQ